MLEREITVVLFLFYVFFFFCFFSRHFQWMTRVVSGRKGQARVLSVSAYSQEFCILSSLPSKWHICFKETVRAALSCGKHSVERQRESSLNIICALALPASEYCHTALNPFYKCNHNVHLSWQKVLFCVVLPSLHILYFRILRVGGMKFIKVHMLRARKHIFDR